MNLTRSTIDRSTHTILFQRELAASPEEAFEAWTDPAQVTVWWDPTGTPLSDCTVDLRPGGAFCFTMASVHAHAFAGVYRVVNRPVELVFDAMGALGTVRFEATGGTTRMTVSIRCSSAEHLEQFVKLGVGEGTDRTLDNLVAHVARPRG